MYPVLLNLFGDLSVKSYGFFFALGILCGGLAGAYLAKKCNIRRDNLLDLIFWSVISAVIGAKIFLFVTEIKYYTAVPSRMSELIGSGGTFYGGLIFALVFAFWYMRKKKMDALNVGDSIAPGIALGHFFGRMGCFFAGCCWGRPAGDCSIGVCFPDHPHGGNMTGVPENIALFPTQLMEAGLNLLNFIFLFLFFSKRKFKGQVFSLYIFNYSIIRFFVEYFRGDSDRGYIFGKLNENQVPDSFINALQSLSVPQFISICGIILSVTLYIIFRKKELNAKS